MVLFATALNVIYHTIVTTSSEAKSSTDGGRGVRRKNEECFEEFVHMIIDISLIIAFFFVSALRLVPLFFFSSVPFLVEWMSEQIKWR